MYNIQQAIFSPFYFTLQIRFHKFSGSNLAGNSAFQIVKFCTKRTTLRSWKNSFQQIIRCQYGLVWGTSPSHHHHITEDLTWTTNTKSISKKAQQRLHFLRRLKRASLPPPILTTFYRGTIESVLTSCITVWYGNCCAADRKTLQRTVNTAAKIIGAPLPSILDIFLTRCSSKAKSIGGPHPPLPQSLPATLR